MSAYQLVATWARQTLATLPAIPTLDMPDDLFIRVERTREDIENLLTALAAMIGAAVILSDPIFQGLAISLLFGLASSTLLTVLVIPAIYRLLRS